MVFWDSHLVEVRVLKEFLACWSEVRVEFEHGFQHLLEVGFEEGEA